MRARLLSVHSDNSGTPIIKMKGRWLEEQGFSNGSRIAVVADTFGRLIIINTDIEAERVLEEEFEKQVYIIGKE